MKLSFAITDGSGTHLTEIELSSEDVIFMNNDPNVLIERHLRPLVSYLVWKIQCRAAQAQEPQQ